MKTHPVLAALDEVFILGLLSKALQSFFLLSILVNTSVAAFLLMCLVLAVFYWR